jgi:20S proteasome alpha/beta subunit
MAICHAHADRTLFLNPSLWVRGGANDVTTTNQQLSSSSDGKSPYEYVPVTALDDYGQSTQLRHAMESAARYGTPVLACLCCTSSCNGSKTENAILVCSLQRPRLGVVGSSFHHNSIVRNTSRSQAHPSIRGIVKILATRDDSTTNDRTTATPQHSLHSALIATGLQSDSVFLMNKLQSHLISKYWFRYDSLPHGEVLLRMIREILLDFLGYDWSEEVGSSSLSGGIGSAAPSANDNEDDSTRAGRPLGVCTFLLELDQTASNDPPSLTVIKANGSSDRYVAYAMGIGSDLGNKRLSQRWRSGMSVCEALESMREILKEIAVDKGWLPERDDNQNDDNILLESLDENSGHDLTIVIETVSRDGIDIKHSPL